METSIVTSNPGKVKKFKEWLWQPAGGVTVILTICKVGMVVCIMCLVWVIIELIKT